MFNVSCRQKTTIKERFDHLKAIEAEVKTCTRCALSQTRKNPVSGKFVEPTDAMVISMMPHPTEDEAGEMLAGGRDKNFAKLFDLAKPSLDVNKMSFVTAFKCYGTQQHDNVCLSFLNDQIANLDPVLLIVFGKELLDLLSGREDLNLDTPYVTGQDDQYVLYGLMHPKDVLADRTKNSPVWKKSLESIASIAVKYDLKILV